MTERRAKIVRQFIVFQLKLNEFIHLALLSLNLENSGGCPENVMSHGASEFRDTLLGFMAVSFMTFADTQGNRTNAREIWCELHPRHARAITRIWERHIAPGQAVMKLYRDQAGAHGDTLANFCLTKATLTMRGDLVKHALDSFLTLSIRLLQKRESNAEAFQEDIRSVLLDTELKLPFSLNRKWFKQALVLERLPHQTQWFI